MIVMICAAFGVAIGFISILPVLSLWVFNRLEPRFLELLSFALIALVFVLFRKKLNLQLAAPSNHDKLRGRSIFEIGLYFSFVAFLFSYLSLTLQLPHGNWDAWAMWNLRAKFLFLGADHWQDMFSESLKNRHPDYPLLLPSLIACSWQFLGKESTLVPQVFGLLFALGITGFLFLALSALRGRKQACIGTSLLLATPQFAQNSASQYADIPLTFYIVGTLVLLLLACQNSTNRNFLLFLAGLFCGFAAWTKNEGTMFVICVGLSWCIYSSLKKTMFSAGTALLALGILPGLLISILFKIYATHVQSFTHIKTTPEIFARLTDASRYVKVGLTFFYEIFRFGGWFYGFPLLILAYLVAVGTSNNFKPDRLNSGTLICMILLMMLGGYALVYLTTPQPLVWHLSTSLNRILFHLWPGTLLFFFQIARTSEEIKTSFGGSPKTA